MTRSGSTGPADDETFEDFLWELDVTRANPDRPDPRLRTAAPSTRPWTVDAAPPAAPARSTPVRPTPDRSAPDRRPPARPATASKPPAASAPARPRRARRSGTAALVVLRILAAVCLLSGTALLVTIALTR